MGMKGEPFQYFYQRPQIMVLDQCHKYLSTYSLGDFIYFHVEKITIFIEMLGLEHSLAYHFVWHLSFSFHHQF